MGAKRRPLLAVTGIAALAAAMLMVSQAASPSASHADGPVIAAHRGAADLHPENTMTGFESVARYFPDVALEMDVQPLNDGSLVVFHDDLINRAAARGDTGAVKEMTPAQWRELRIRDPKGGEPVPAPFLSDVLDRFGGTDKLLLIELKHPDGRQDFIEALRPYQDQVILQSFNDDNTRAFVSAGFKAIQLMGSPRAVIQGVYATGLPITSVTPESVDDAHAVGAEAWLWGPDLQMDDPRASELDIGGYMVNDPRP